MQRLSLAPLEESALIASAKRGDLEAFNTLVLTHQDFLFDLAVRILDDDRAADAVQEALVSAYRCLSMFHGGSFRAWLARTLINKCYDEHRRSSRHPCLPLMPVVDGEEVEDWSWLCDPSPSPQALLETSELNATLQHCMNTLPFDHRTVLALVDVDGLSYDEAAAALEIPIGTVKSRLARARATMRQSLRAFADLLPSPFQAIPA